MSGLWSWLKRNPGQAMLLAAIVLALGGVVLAAALRGAINAPPYCQPGQAGPCGPR